MKLTHLLSCSALAAATAATAFAAPTVSRLTPPSLRFSTGEAGAPYIARFLPGQRFDLQATVRPDAGQTITAATFKINNVTVPGTVTLIPTTVSGLPVSSVSPTLRAHRITAPGVYTLTVTATQSDGLEVTATGEFEIVGITATGRKAKNIIYMIGDGMGIAHRTAARILYKNVASGKALDPLVMDTFSNTALVQTASLNSIITDSSPGAACYATGNKSNNNQQGVFPDDTTDAFDNPRVELIGEYLARTQGKSLGIVATSDVFDATPGSFGTHTANRGAGTGICDQYLDEAAANGGLTVLLGGGRKWFLPSTTAGSARSASNDYALPAELASAWGVATGNATDTNRDLIADFQTAGFTYAANKTELVASSASATKLLGLFAFSNMNVAKDKLDKRRGDSTIVDAYGLPDQPMLEEMTTAALNVLSKDAQGFVLMVEAASIDKQAHAMDTERWLLDTIEFDKAIGVAKAFAQANPDTLVIVTADHECAGVNIIGAANTTLAQLQARSVNADAATGKTQLQGVVGVYEAAGFPVYSLHADGYPAATDIDYKMLIGYAGNADRYEDWLTNAQPTKDSQQPSTISSTSPYSTFPAGPLNRDTAGNFFIAGQANTGGGSAVHTGSDIPLSAHGRGANLFNGVMDNTDVFFKVMQAAIGGAK
jgi:alkaline phosphatase